MQPLIFRKTVANDSSGVWHNDEFDAQIRQCFGALLAGPAVAKGLREAKLIEITRLNPEIPKVTSEMLRCWGEELNLHLGAPDLIIDDLIRAANTLVDEKADDLSYHSFKNFILAAITYGCPIDELRQTFNEMDSNKDGYVYKEELETQLKTLASDWLEPNAACELFARMDTKADGRVSFEEFANAMAPTLPRGITARHGSGRTAQDRDLYTLFVAYFNDYWCREQYRTAKTPSDILQSATDIYLLVVVLFLTLSLLLWVYLLATLYTLPTFVVLGYVHDSLTKPAQRIRKTPMFRAGCVACFIVNLPVVVLAIACLVYIVIVGYILSLPLAIVTFRFQHWPSNLALLRPYLTDAWQRPGWWLFEEHLICILGMINRHRRGQDACPGTPQWMSIWLHYAKIFTLTPILKYVCICNPICTKLSKFVMNQNTFVEHEQGTQVADIINSTNGSTHFALFDYENYEALDKVAPTPAVKRGLMAGDIRNFKFKPFYPYPSDGDGTKEWRRNYCMGIQWVPNPGMANWNLTNSTCNHTPRGDGGFAHCEELEKAAGFRRLPRTNSRSMTAERAMYLVWLGFFWPFHMFTGYVEVNLSAPSIREKNNDDLAKEKAETNPDLQPTGQIQYGLEHPMWMIVGDNVLAAIPCQKVGNLFYDYGPQILRLADILRAVVDEGKAPIVEKVFTNGLRQLRAEWMLKRVTPHLYHRKELI